MKDFHKTSKWKSKRERILRRDEYQCQECKRYGKTTEAVMVHHIVPVEERAELALEGDNLTSLCNKCHNEMHDRTTNQLTSKGKQLVERMKRRSPHLF